MNAGIRIFLGVLVCMMVFFAQAAFASAEAQTLPDTVPGELNLSSGSEYSGGTQGASTNITGGPIRGPQGSGTAKISNYSITNNASNSFGGGANSNGSAFISRTDNGLDFDTVSIDSKSAASLVFNIWANRSISAKSVTIDGGNYLGFPFLLVGGYPNGGAGTLNFSGTSAIDKMTNTSICGGSNNSVINVTDGTLTIKDSDLALRDGVRFVVKNGATLLFDNTVLDVTGSSAVAAITVEEGGKLVLQNGSKVKAAEARDFNQGIIVSSGTVEIKGSSISGISKTGGSSSLIEIKKGDLTITDSTIEGNAAPNARGGIILVNNAGTVTIDGKTKFNNNSSGNTPIYVGQSAALNISGTSTFSGNSSTGSGNTYGGALWAYKTPVTIGDGVSFTKNTAKFGGAVYLQECAGTTIGKASFEGNGTSFESGDWPEIQTMDGGALYIREGSAVLNGTVFRENIAAFIKQAPYTASGGAAYIYGANVKINGAKLSNNLAQTYGGALTIAHDSRAEIGDLDGDPAEFKGNLVEIGMDFAGGGMFINNAYVRMMDAAIYNNAAEDAGGGLSACTTGTAEVRGLDGAAIFDNEILAGEHAGGSGFFPPVEDVRDYQDIFFQTTDHRDAETGEIIPGRNGFPAYAYELYERMFNGDVHNWKAKPVIITNDDNKKVNALVAQSDPGSRDVSKAKVIFTENQAWRHPELTTTVSGGAIGCNGLLEIGTSTEIKILKLWNDKENKTALPSAEDFLKSIKILADGEEISKEDLQITVITEDVDKHVLFNNVVNADGKPVDFGKNEPWLIIVSGLPKYAEGSDGLEIKYTVKEDEPVNYRLVKEEGDMETFFTLENEVRLMDIPVEKVWVEEENYTALRPKEITVSLLADGEKVGELKLNEGNGWKGTFRNLVKYKGDQEIEYTVKESMEGDLAYYLCKESGDASSGFTITNTLELYTAAETSGVKTWIGDGDVLEKRPSEIKVTLLADGEKVRTIRVTEADGWKIGFGKLPKYKNGKMIEYSIVEDGVEDYEAAYDGYDMTNTYTGPKPHNGDDDGDDDDGDDRAAGGTKGVGTGDRAPIAPLAALLAVCAAAAAAIRIRRRKQIGR